MRGEGMVWEGWSRVRHTGIPSVSVINYDRSISADGCWRKDCLGCRASARQEKLGTLRSHVVSIPWEKYDTLMYILKTPPTPPGFWTRWCADTKQNPALATLGPRLRSLHVALPRSVRTLRAEHSCFDRGSAFVLDCVPSQFVTQLLAVAPPG